MRARHFSWWASAKTPGIATGELPRQHDDPVDRMLIAQALVRSTTVAGVDRYLGAYGVSLLST